MRSRAKKFVSVGGGEATASPTFSNKNHKHKFTMNEPITLTIMFALFGAYLIWGEDIKERIKRIRNK